MYASLRTDRIGGSGSVDAVMRRVDRDFAEALSQEPGFVAYHTVDTGNDMVLTISLFHDRNQAEASNELAAQWVAEELSDFNVTRVGVIGGEVRVSRASAEILETAHPWSGSFRLEPICRIQALAEPSTTPTDRSCAIPSRARSTGEPTKSVSLVAA